MIVDIYLAGGQTVQAHVKPEQYQDMVDLIKKFGYCTSSVARGFLELVDELPGQGVYRSDMIEAIVVVRR